MCLIIDRKLTNKMKKDKQQVLTFYKILRRVGTYKPTFETPFQYQLIMGPGDQIEDFPKKINWFTTKIYDRALHLFTNINFVKEFMVSRSHKVFFEVKVKKEDIIAYGKGYEVAVKQYNISKSEWIKATTI